MSSFSITMRDETGAAVGALEACIRNANDWKVFWSDRRGPISTAWAKSRQEMFMTGGKSTGAAWTPYTYLEKKYWTPRKRWSLGVGRLNMGSLLRWTSKPHVSAVAPNERLYPSMTVTNHPNYVYKAEGTKVELGTSLSYARNHNEGVGELTLYTSKKKSKTVTIPTPKRPLVRFGVPFSNSVQNELNRTAMMQQSGSKVGITSSGLAGRINFARSRSTT